MRLKIRAGSLLAEFIALGLLAALLAVGMNTMRPDALPWWGNEAADISDDMGEEDGVIETQRALELFATGKAVFIDSRYPEDYALGHIPGAVNITTMMMEPDVKAVLEGLPTGKPWVIYCSSVNCPMSWELGELLRFMGYNDLLIYEQGWKGWSEAGGEAEVTK